MLVSFCSATALLSEGKEGCLAATLPIYSLDLAFACGPMGLTTRAWLKLQPASLFVPDFCSHSAKNNSGTVGFRHPHSRPPASQPATDAIKDGLDWAAVNFVLVLFFLSRLFQPQCRMKSPQEEFSAAKGHTHALMARPVHSCGSNFARSSRLITLFEHVRLPRSVRACVWVLGCSVCSMHTDVRPSGLRICQWQSRGRRFPGASPRPCGSRSALSELCRSSEEQHLVGLLMRYR